MKKTVLVCDSQPVTAEGVRTVLDRTDDLSCETTPGSLSACVTAAGLAAPDVILLDKAFGLQPTLEALAKLRAAAPNAGVVVWGLAVTEPEAVEFLQAGARGIVRKSATAEMLVSCLRSVAGGTIWMDPSLLSMRPRPAGAPRATLTPRERQVLELVGEGLKNREIARRLGIGPGTVKVHLKHLFEKTGANSRHQLALVDAVA